MLLSPVARPVAFSVALPELRNLWRPLYEGHVKGDEDHGDHDDDDEMKADTDLRVIEFVAV